MLNKRLKIYFGFFIFGLLSLYFLNFLERAEEKSVASKEIVADKEQSLSDQKLKEFFKGCENLDADSCLSLGYLYLRGGDRERDFSKAKSYFEKACDNFKDPVQGELQCEAIARIYENGSEARVDKKIADIFHEKAKVAHQKRVVSATVTPTPEECVEGDPKACFRLGRDLLISKKDDLKKAEEILLKTCDTFGVKPTQEPEEYPGKFCGLVAELFEFGRDGLEADLEKAGSVYKRACDIAINSPERNGFMCDLAGNFFRDKKKNLHAAASLYQKACKMDHLTACEHLKNLGISSDETL